MDRAYNLLINNQEHENLKRYVDFGKTFYDKHKRIFESIIAKSMLSDGQIDAAVIQEMMFPIVSADVFLSHSSKDSELAYAVAGYINNIYKKNVFIDSAFWGNMYDLEYELNCKFSMGQNDLFDYSKHDYIASHTMMLLATSLSSMISNTKYFVFLNTNNSLPEISVTNSSWIYYELHCANQYLRRPINESRKFASDSMPRFKYDIEKYIENFETISLHELYKL